MAKWLLDAGHGGTDPGAIYNNRKEDDDVLKLTKRVGEMLKTNGEIVDFTRTTDKTLSLAGRTNIENASNYDYFVSFHRNAFEPEKAEGIETYSFSTTGKGRELAEKIQKGLVPFFKDRKCKTENFYVLRKTKCPAVLIEVGFIDNTKDNRTFDNNFENIAKGIAKACLAQVGKSIKETQEPVKNNPDGFYRVIVGSYKDRQNAINAQNNLKQKGFDSFLEFKK